MNQSQDSHVIYHELLTSSMMKLLKCLPKQLTNLRTLVEKSLDQINQVKQDKSRFDTNANKYFMIYKYGIELKQPKITECCLYDVEKLISHNFLDGYSYDFVEKDANANSNNTKKIDRMLIDSIAEVIISCSSMQEDNIHFLIVKCLQAIFKQSKSPITQETLQLSIRTLFKFYKQEFYSTKQIIQDVIQQVFTRYTLLIKLTDLDKELMQNRLLNQNQIIQSQCINQDEQDENNINQVSVDTYIQQYIQITLINMVDDVVIYNEKLKNQQNNNNIPLTCVPQAYEAEDLKYKNFIEVKIPNEQQIISSKFGWCIMCRQPAPYFCKDTRVPVCSVPCKKQHFELTENIRLLSKPDNRKLIYQQDCIDTFNYLCQKAKDEKSKKQEFCLELIFKIIKEYKIALNTIYDKIFKESFVNTLLVTLQNKSTIYNSLQILIELIYHQRDLIPTELEALIEFILQRLSTEFNSQIIAFVESIANSSKLLLELFCNHDCTINRKNIVQILFEFVAKIGQGQNVNQEICLQANQLIKIIINQLLDMICIFQEQNIAFQAPEQIEQSDAGELKQMIKNIESFDSHEKQLTYKQQLQKAISKFQFSAKDCFNYLIHLNLLEERNIKQYVEFLYNNQLNKDQLGQYFGSGNEFNQKVLLEYTKLIDFHNLNISDSLRKYLALFTLPGEAQQVDRIMLIFSVKYYEDNKNVIFKNADEAYVFSYLLIILQTDMHNKSVQNKMTFEQFQKSSKLSMERDLDEQYLRDVYQSISEQPLAIHSSIEKKNPIYKDIQKSQQNHAYIFQPSIDYIKLFMEVVWPSLFVNLNILIERQDDQGLITIALENAESSILLMTLVGLQESCEQFIKIICSLGWIIENRNLKFKNYRALKCILNLAISNGNSLKHNWSQVLALVSYLDYIFGEKQKGKMFLEPMESMSKVLCSIADMACIDKIMQNTKYMDSRTILDFLQALIEVSLKEISSQQPRIFSLQRIGEVTSFNMDRIRLIWTQIWNLLKGHFITACVHDNLEVALYASDQLKQLSVKFLQKHEHNRFSFQKEFLQPFDIAFSQTKYFEVKEFILSCMRMLAHLCFYNLKSGWKVVMNIVNQALQDEIQLVNIALEVMEKLVSEDIGHMVDVFQDIEMAFFNIFQHNEKEILLKGIELVYQAVDNSIKKQDVSIFYAFWMQSLANLCNLFRSTQTEVQECAIKTFFKVLKTNNKSIEGSQYTQIMRGMMKDLFQSLENANKDLCVSAHNSLLELVLEHDIKEIYNELLHILVQNSSNKNEHLAKTGVLTFKQIIIKQASKLNWNTTIQSLGQMVEHTQPNILLDACKLDESLMKDIITLTLPDTQLIINSDEQVLLCSLQLMLIDIIDDIQQYHIQLINESQFDDLLTIIQELYNKSYLFNRQFKVRYFLKQKGLMPQLSTLPGLIKQEKQAFSCLSNMIWKQYQTTKDQKLMNNLLKLINELLNDTKQLQNTSHNQMFQIEAEKLIINNLTIIQQPVLQILNQIDLQQIQSQLKTLLQSFVILPSCFSILMGQCPHCQKCPFQCYSKQEWKKLQMMIQNFELKIINNL